jgi:ubiquinone biosynthesis UbiH/UbiF/VisC/COQ6 family hydroxylase
MPALDTTPGSATCEVSVHGSGAVGMAAALALARLGLKVDWHADASPPGRQDVRAYAVNRAAVELLRGLRVWDAMAEDARTPVHDMHVVGDDMQSALDFRSWQLEVGELAWIVDAAELEAALRSALRFAAHVRARPRLAPGECGAGMLEVVADGKEGALRATHGVRWTRHAYGHTAIAARLHLSQPHANVARQWFRHPDVLALLPLDRPARGQGAALVWSLPAARAAELLALGEAAFEAELAAALAAGGAPGIAPRLASERQSWPLQLAKAEAVHGPGWVLLGDAAHVVHPLAGQGLNLGLGDVAALAAVLGAREPWRSLADERLLARYGRARAGATQAMRWVTDGLLQLFSRDEPALRWLRNRGLELVDRLPPLKRALAGQAFGR